MNRNKIRDRIHAVSSVTLGVCAVGLTFVVATGMVRMGVAILTSEKSKSYESHMGIIAGTGFFFGAVVLVSFLFVALSDEYMSPFLRRGKEGQK